MQPDPVIPQRLSQQPARIESVNWLFEPLWSGDHLIAQVRGDQVTLNDERGEVVDEVFPEIGPVLAPSVSAVEAIIDGVWTAQPFLGEGSSARQWAETLEAEGLADEMPDPFEMEKRRAFVAIDLVELDGEELYGLPYQERRRLLGAVVIEGPQVRVSPAVRLPITSWLIAWRSNGFTEYVAKHSNSRYLPGEVNRDCIRMPVESRGPGMAQRLLGFRRERTIRIRD